MVDGAMVDEVADGVSWGGDVTGGVEGPLLAVVPVRNTLVDLDPVAVEPAPACVLVVVLVVDGPSVVVISDTVALVVVVALETSGNVVVAGDMVVVVAVASGSSRLGQKGELPAVRCCMTLFMVCAGL